MTFNFALCDKKVIDQRRKCLWLIFCRKLEKKLSVYDTFAFLPQNDRKWEKWQKLIVNLRFNAQQNDTKKWGPFLHLKGTSLSWRKRVDPLWKKISRATTFTLINFFLRTSIFVEKDGKYYCRFSSLGAYIKTGLKTCCMLYCQTWRVIFQRGGHSCTPACMERLIAVQLEDNYTTHLRGVFIPNQISQKPQLELKNYREFLFIS